MPQTRMVDVSAKRETERLAMALGRIYINKETISLIKKHKIAKGDVLNAAQVAGIMAAKRTPDFIPLCHPLLISKIDVDLEIAKSGNYIDIIATVKGRGKTGYEMEALTAASVAALTIYDMCKMHDKGMKITDLRLVKKSGGKSGTYTAE